MRRAGGCGPLTLPRPRLVSPGADSASSWPPVNRGCCLWGVKGKPIQDDRPPASGDMCDSYSCGRSHRATSAPSAPVVCVPPSACKPTPTHPSRLSMSCLLREAFLDTPGWAASALCKKPIERNLSLLFQWPNSGPENGLMPSSTRGPKLWSVDHSSCHWLATCPPPG